MRIYISSPGQFYEGFNSKLRGEGRWLAHMAGVLAASGHEVRVFSNDPMRPYKDRGVVFDSIINSPPSKECDVLVSMDAFMDLPHVHKTNISEILEKRFSPRKRVWAGYFPIGGEQQEVYDYIPVIHPWKYDPCLEGKATCIPVITHDSVKEPDFNKNRFYWYSKNAHEEPQYIAGVMQGLFELVKHYGAAGTFVDGIQIGSQKFRKEYPEPKEQKTKIFFKEIVAAGSESFSTWAPYDYVQQRMAESKLLVGVHHPVAAPSMAEIAAWGGFPVLFKNQKDCPPYNNTDIPFIPENASDEEVRGFILRMWTDKELFTASVLKCQEAIEDHSSRKAASTINDFFDNL